MSDVLVTGLWRFPVKSMQGEAVDAVEIGPNGIDCDRHWAVRDVASGLTLTGRRQPDLLMASARLAGDGVQVVLPDGTVAAGDEQLSAWLGRPVALVEAADERSTYEAPLDDEDEAGDWHAWQGPAGSFHDSTRAAVSLAGAPSFGDWDPRRFRINVVVDSLDEQPELVGRTIVAGTARLEVRRLIDRCVVVTRAQPGIEHDLDVLRTVNRDRAGCLGIGALVMEPGRLAIGDEVTFD